MNNTKSEVSISPVSCGGWATAQNVFSTVYVDALITRGRDVTGSTSGSGRKLDGTLSGGLEERTFYQTMRMSTGTEKVHPQVR